MGSGKISVRAEEVDGEVLVERGTIAQVVVDRHAGVVDEDVERFDPLDSSLIWDWNEGSVERTIAIPAFIAAASPADHLFAARNRLGTSLSGETVDVWDSATGRRVATLAGNTGARWL